VIPTWRGHNEQTMAHAAIAYAKAKGRRKAMAVTSSIGPGATNMVTAAALAHVNRLPGPVHPRRRLRQPRARPGAATDRGFRRRDGFSANDCFRPVVRYFDRISRPEHILTALPRALRVMTDPANCGPVCLAFCQDTQAEAYDYPVEFFDPASGTSAAPNPTSANWKPPSPRSRPRRPR
jgi:3D-(3,5/4)-trihydroxycyclohexane-1,2-dione acylhydrolase (decyclizing)